MQEPVLVLNANFEPINVCSMRRAIGLILGEKAAMVVNGRGHIHTVSQLLPRPSIIRLEHMIHRPRPRVKLTRREVFRRDNYTCQYCGRQGYILDSRPHPAQAFGRQTYMDKCGRGLPGLQPSQGWRKLEEVHMNLLHIPKEPSASAVYLYGRHLDENGEWEPFITGW